MNQARLARQELIEGWNQEAISDSKLLVVGDQGPLASIYALGAAALGVDRIVILAPQYDEGLLTVAKRVNKACDLGVVQGNLVHPEQLELFGFFDVALDASQSRLANKILLNQSSRGNVDYVHLINRDDESSALFTYHAGRNWQALNDVLANNFFPQPAQNGQRHDFVLDHVLAGIALDETSRALQQKGISDEVITYNRGKLNGIERQPKILVVGAGALGNFVGMNLAAIGYTNLTIIDPDTVDVSNLNRQVLFYDKEGEPKADVLATRLEKYYGVKAKAQQAYIDKPDLLIDYDVIFGCVDNFQTRIILSEGAKKHKKLLFSGGTSISGGQAIAYNPKTHKKTPAEKLELEKVVTDKTIPQRSRASCVYTPEPSVIMSNQIIAGIMVDQYRQLQDDKKPQDYYYDANSAKKL